MDSDDATTDMDVEYRHLNDICDMYFRNKGRSSENDKDMRIGIQQILQSMMVGMGDASTSAHSEGKELAIRRIIMDRSKELQRLQSSLLSNRIPPYLVDYSYSQRVAIGSDRLSHMLKPVSIIQLNTLQFGSRNQSSTIVTIELSDKDLDHLIRVVEAAIQGLRAQKKS